MLKARQNLIVPCVAMLVFVFGSAIYDMHAVGATASVRVSSDVASLPKRSDISAEAASVSENSVRVSGVDALSTARAEFNVQDAEIDPTVGMVLARISVYGDTRHQRELVWILGVNRTFPGLTPSTRGMVTHKMCIVVSATTGKYEFAYLV